MKYVKMLGLTAVVAAALLAFTGSASATVLTSPAGTQLGVGATFEATSTHGVLTGAGGLVTITCTHSRVHGHISNAGGSSATVKVTITSLDFTNCANGWSVTVIKPGELEIHTEGTSSNGNGTVTSIGAEVTTENGSLHCIYTTTTATDIGNLTGSINRSGSTALMDISGTITRSGGRSGAFCGASGAWTGSYTVTSPDYLDVD